MKYERKLPRCKDCGGRHVKLKTPSGGFAGLFWRGCEWVQLANGHWTRKELTEEIT